MKVIKEPLFKVHLQVFRDRKEYNRFRISNGGEPMPEHVIANTSLYWVAGQRVLSVFVPTDATPGIIAHECLHVATFICSEKGVQFDRDNDEVVAYLLEFFVDRIPLCNTRTIKKRSSIGSRREWVT